MKEKFEKIKKEETKLKKLEEEIEEDEELEEEAEENFEQNIEENTKKGSLFKRYVIFLIGVFINSFGIILITKSDLGTSQIASVSYVFSLKYEFLSFGMSSFILNMIFWAVQMYVLKGKWNKSLFIQIPACVIFASLMNLEMSFLSAFEPHNIIIKFIVLLLGCVVLGFGICVEVMPNVTKIPGEGIVYAIAQEKHIQFGRVKVLFDSILVILAIIFSFIFFRGIRGIGIGTVASALLVGRVVRFFEPFVSKQYNKIM